MSLLTTNYLYMRPFLWQKKEDRSHNHATCECRSFYPALNIICVLSIHVFMYFIYILYISQVKTRSIHSEKESRKCRTLYSTHTRKRPRYQTKVNIETRGFRTRVCRLESNWIRDTRRGYADSAWDVNTRFITAQWTRFAALKGLTKIIPGSRVENRARARNTYCTRCNPESMHNVERNRVAAAADRFSICR